MYFKLIVMLQNGCSISTVSKRIEIFYVEHVGRKCQDFLRSNNNCNHAIKQILLENFRNILLT